MTKAQNIYEQEKAQALSIFRTESLCNFLYIHAHDIVGKDRNGVSTTLMDEVGEVARMAHRAYVSDGVNYYRSGRCFSMAELDEETVKENSKRMYIRAAKKLFFLNSVSKSLTGEYIIARRIDDTSLEQVTALVDAFEWCVRHYSEISGR